MPGWLEVVRVCALLAVCALAGPGLRPCAAQGYVPVTGLPGGASPGDVAALAGPELAQVWWTLDPDPGVIGYNLYAATDGQSFYPVNQDGPITGGNYLDTGLVNGATYYHCVTAVRWDGAESDPSVVVWARPAEQPVAPRLSIRLETENGRCVVGGPMAVRVSVLLAAWAVPGARVTLQLPDGSNAQITTNSQGQAVFASYVPQQAGLQSIFASVQLNHQYAEAAEEVVADASAS